MNPNRHFQIPPPSERRPAGSEARLGDRREFLWRFGGGLGGVALAHLLGAQGLLAETPAPRPAFNGGLHHRARARRVVQLFMSGAASQCDTFDYKPELIKQHGTKFDPGGQVELFQSSPENCMKSPWEWKSRGQCGKWISELVPHLGSCVDDLAFIQSMVSKSNVHGPATYLQNTGFVLPGFPNMGAWISYGLGSLSENLPAFVVLPDPRGFGPNGPANWSAGFLPATHQGTMIRIGRPNPIFDLFPPKTPVSLPRKASRKDWSCSNRSTAGTRRSAMGIRGWTPASPLTNWPRDSNSARRKRWTCLANPKPPRSSTVSMKKSPRISARVASSPAVCSNGVSVSCRSGVGRTTVFPAAIGTATKTWRETTSKWERAWTNRLLRWSKT